MIYSILGGICLALFCISAELPMYCAVLLPAGVCFTIMGFLKDNE